MEKRPVKSFFLFVLAFALIYIWDANNVPPWGFVPFGIAIGLCVVYGVRYWRGVSYKNVLVPRPKR